MKFYGGTPTNEQKKISGGYVTVRAHAPKVRFLLNLLGEKGLITDERAAAVAGGPDVFAVFNGGFSHREIGEALAEAEALGSVVVELVRAPYVHAEAELEAHPELAAKPEPVPVPEPEAAPEPPKVEPTAPAPNILNTIFGTPPAYVAGPSEAKVTFVRSNEQPTRSAEIEPAPETTGPEKAD